jgi:hypothetical protein
VGAVTRIVAHGGIPGLIAELGIALGAMALFAWIWWRERRRRARRNQRLTTKPP